MLYTYDLLMSFSSVFSFQTDSTFIQLSAASDREWIKSHCCALRIQLIKIFRRWVHTSIQYVEVYQIEGQPAAVGRAAKAPEGALRIPQGESMVCHIIWCSMQAIGFRVFSQTRFSGLCSREIPYTFALQIVLFIYETTHFLSAENANQNTETFISSSLQLNASRCAWNSFRNLFSWVGTSFSSRKVR